MSHLWYDDLRNFTSLLLDDAIHIVADEDMDTHRYSTP